MNTCHEYIYIRKHQDYDSLNAFKLGKTDNIPNRDSQYATGEIKRGYFDIVFEVQHNESNIIEHILQDKFRKYNIKYNAGTEFYNKDIIMRIEPYIKKLGFKYRKLTSEEISELVRCTRRKLNKKENSPLLINIPNAERTGKYIGSYIPRNDQTIIIDKSIIHFQQADKGLLLLMCGVGKTLISLWITQKINANKLIIGVPNKLLLKQWLEVISILFKEIPYLLVSSGVNKNNITQFLENNKKQCILITTYSSAHKVYNAIQDISFIFDMKILDEVHHLTSININEKDRKTYINMLKINSNKQLSLTATLKILENKETERDSEIIVSNDNIKYFGDIIDRKSLLWAINNNIICDYKIQTIITNEENIKQILPNFNINEDNDKRMFLSAYASLKSISDSHTHHLLIYSNNKDNSLKIIQYIKMLLDDTYFNISNLYYSNYHSEMNLKTQKTILTKFENANFGIISCVYCLGEGWDFPLLDGVVFSENMTSNIRIVQSALRASRKYKNEPNKITKIILPLLTTELNNTYLLENNNNPDLKKVKAVIYQLGLEDETITQKIKVLRINISKQSNNITTKIKKGVIDNFGEYNDDLTQQLQLYTIKRTSLGIGYEKVRKIIANKNIKSKADYYELCDMDNRLSKEPEIVFKGQFTNWIDYLGIERKYYDLETCKNKVGEYLVLYPEIKKHYLELSTVSNKLCKIDKSFPPYELWVEYYNVKDLRDIITITNNKKRRTLIS
jgi:superfamily II DNA or RNA helicase